MDLHERAMDICFNSGCPGCWWCGEYIEKEEVVQLCSDCIISKEGQVDLEDCEYACPNYDYGLEGVRQHHGLTLEEMKRDLGY